MYTKCSVIYLYLFIENNIYLLCIKLILYIIILLTAYFEIIKCKRYFPTQNLKVIKYMYYL